MAPTAFYRGQHECPHTLKQHLYGMPSVHQLAEDSRESKNVAGAAREGHANDIC